MNGFSEYDLIQAMSGVDSFGEPKCSVTVRLQQCHEDGHWSELDDEFISEKPVVQVCKQAGGFVLVDLIFRSVQDRDLKTIFSYIDRYFSPENSVSDDGLSFSLLSVALVPYAFEGKYWAMGMNPIWFGLVPDDSEGEPKIIRLAFVMQDGADSVPNFVFLSSGDSELEAIRGEEQGAVQA